MIGDGEVTVIGDGEVTVIGDGEVAVIGEFEIYADFQEKTRVLIKLGPTSDNPIG